MRLAILDNAHSVGTKAKFALIRAASRLPVPDAVKLNRYRPDFSPRRRCVDLLVGWRCELMGARVAG
jgi:hypothetical protein